MRSLKFRSYAKINLYLEVLKRRKDNYHQILTLFERIDLTDEIFIKPRPDQKIRIVCTHPDVPKRRANLAYQAALLLKKDFSINRGVDIRIHKHIPVAAGLGGGSSNGAVVLLGLNRLWKLGLSKGKLISYGKALGSDVPFFLSHASFAIGSSRGDQIKNIRSIKKRFWHIVVVPQLKVSTQKVYAQWDKTLKKKILQLTKTNSNVKILIHMLKQANIPLIKQGLFNRLEEATFSLCPKLKEIKQRLQNLGLEEISMSGSGPAMFGIFSSRKEADRICRQLSRFKELKAFVTKTS